MRDVSTIRGLSLTQPWASAVALGHKKVETRSFRVSYRGPIAIHASKAFPREAQEFAITERDRGRCVGQLPLGQIVAIANLVDCKPTEDVAAELSGLERLYGNYTPGRWAWFLANIECVPSPIPCRGALGLWQVPAPVIRELPVFYESGEDIPSL
jgi:hypothetical protein